MRDRPLCPRCGGACSHLGYCRWQCTQCELVFEHVPPDDRLPERG